MRPPSPHDRIAMSLAYQRFEEPTERPRSRPALGPQEREALRCHAHEAILAGLRRLGAPHPADLQDETGFLHLPVGSARCTLGIVALEERDLFVAYAPVMDLPSDRDLILPLYRLLLEMNNRFELSIAKFGLHGDTVYLSAMRPLEGLDPEEVEDTVRWVSRFADDMDDRLFQEFGGTSKRRET